ncbi:MAG TPA: biotin--[acetyl-CoA-carboxylase] ligase [Candidatus Limivivens merdigallinarum]|uniref:Bifunctional ligase/repressor BirA n=1 Tax=Candidatus Limivivens merdigallinarum TaxID=2840859 RepID=A0A9D1D1R6_9FIRM|nr:biotin--[acetyl-CoA-carboxylase] ligase [Candidatus Limivivens merdigallinarum]
MKSKILEILKARDGYVSGQELSEYFQVSRTAVWKAVARLKEEGYQIESVQKKGYRLVASPDVVLAEEIQSILKTRWAAREICYLKTVDSTNRYAKKKAEEGAPHGALVVAEEQTQGKGRMGRNWSDPAGQNIAMTLILRPAIQPQSASMVTLVAGLSVARALKTLCGLDVKIKWPNDVVAGGRKLCGILSEMSAEMSGIHYLVIGIGINVNTEHFPEELRDKATSLYLETGEKMQRARIIAACMEYFEEDFSLFEKTMDLSLLKDQYEALLINKDEKVKVLERDASYVGIAKGIDWEGELLVEKEDGSLTRVYAGEVSVRGVYGYT